VRIGICAPIELIATLDSTPFDYIEESVVSFLMPEFSDELFSRKIERSNNMGIPIFIFNNLFPPELKVIGPNINENRIDTYLYATFQRANESGAKLIVFGSGQSRNIESKTNIIKQKNEFIERVRNWGLMAKEFKLKIAIEPLHFAETNFINTLYDADDIVTEVDQENICLMVDYYHMCANNEPFQNIEMINNEIVHVHIAELKNRTHPGSTNDDYHEFFNILNRMGYDDTISIECMWKDFTSNAAKSVKYLKSQLNNIFT